MGDLPTQDEVRAAYEAAMDVAVTAGSIFRQKKDRFLTGQWRCCCGSRTLG
jgi:hypothetical protein